MDQKREGPTGDMLNLLEVVDNGRFRQVMDQALGEAVMTLHRHKENAGGVPKGRITITLAMAYDGEHVEVAPQIALTMPKPIRGKTIFFRTPDDGLSEFHPKQTEMFTDAARAPDAADGATTVVADPRANDQKLAVMP